MRDRGLLKLDSVIVHEVPARLVQQGGQGPTLSEIESPLDQSLKNYFREKIITSLERAAFDVDLDEDSTSPVPQLVLANLSGSETLVDVSRDMANHLFGCQTGVNSSGLLAVAQASVQGQLALAILKLEKEEGVRVLQGTHRGRRTFNMEHIRQLMLTEQTRVFKVGLFLQEGDSLASIDAAVSDKQRGYQPSTEIADFFLKKFLGCRLREEPEVVTKRFFQVAQDFVNTQISDPASRGRYEIALLASLSSEAPSLDPTAFACDYLLGRHRRAFVDSLADAGAPTRIFTKDIALIEHQLQRIQMNFESGVVVVAPPETFDNEVKMESLDDGKTRLQIEDRMKDIRGKR